MSEVIWGPASRMLVKLNLYEGMIRNFQCVCGTFGQAAPLGFLQ